MRKRELIEFYESEVRDEKLAVEIRHGAAKELSVLRKWRSSLTTHPAPLQRRVARGVKKWQVFQQWLEQRCPKEYRRPSIDGGIDEKIRDWMFVYIRNVKRSKFCFGTLDEAFQKYIEQQAQAQQPVTAEENSNERTV